MKFEILMDAMLHSMLAKMPLEISQFGQVQKEVNSSR